MARDSLMDQARNAASLARKKGANDAAVVSYQSRNVDVTWRDGKIEKITEATSRGLGLSLYVDGKYSSVSTNDLRPEALDRFVEEAVALTRTLTADPFRKLPEPSLYAGQAKVDLQLDDPAYDSVTAVDRRKKAEALEVAARNVKRSDAILSVTTRCGDAIGESARVHTNGFEGERKDTSFYVGATVSVKDADGRRPQESQYASSRFHDAMPPVEEIGLQASQRALGRLGARKMGSGVFTIAVENRAGGGLVGRLMGPLSAGSLQQKRSFYEDRLNTQIGSKLLHLTDDPLVVRGLSSRLYDGEGIAAKVLPVFDGGVVKTVYVDTYYGRKLGMAPTTGGSSNLVWKLGDKNQDALLAQLKNGVLITGFLGGNSNGTTGDFSMGVEGFRVVDGQIAEPVSEMNVSGNHLELWKQLTAVGNDPYIYSSMGTPTLVFEGVQLAGT